MTIIRNKAIIDLTEEERKAIKIVARIAHDILYGLNDDETGRFDDIMKASWVSDTVYTKISICDLSCLLDRFENNIDEFNS